MRDSQIGSFGALALVLVVVLKIALVAAVLARGHHLWLLAIPAVGRVAASALSATLPYAREQGTGAALVSGGRRAERLAVALATALVVALACARLRGLLAVAAVPLVALVIGRLALRRIGGVTGDVLGAAIELAECAALLALLAAADGATRPPRRMPCGARSPCRRTSTGTPRARARWSAAVRRPPRHRRVASARR